MKEDKYCRHCSISFVNDHVPCPGNISNIGKSFRYVLLDICSDQFLEPAPVTIEVFTVGYDDEFPERLAYFVPLYCPFCGRLIKENIPYLEEEKLIDNNKTLLLKG